MIQLPITVVSNQITALYDVIVPHDKIIVKDKTNPAHTLSPLNDESTKQFCSKVDLALLQMCSHRRV